jgi:photosystem II stability/assembly factor-like uncharacterized protein
MHDIVYTLAAVRSGISASPPNGLILAGRESGLYLSRDGGKTWEDAYKKLDLPTNLPTMTLALAPEAEGQRQAVFAGVPGGVLSSFDDGQSWQVARFPEPPPIISCLAVSPVIDQDGVILAGTVEDGVFRSADRGRSWARWNFGLLDLNVLSLAISPQFSQDETIFAGTETGVFRSTNGGRAWREVDFPMDLAPVLSLAVSPHSTQDGLIFSGTEGNGLHLSSDRGKSWRLVSDLFTGATINTLLVEAAGAGPFRLLALTDEQLLVSRDSGVTWGEWERQAPEEAGISCLVAPHGLAAGAPILAGTVEGEVLWI